MAQKDSFWPEISKVIQFFHPLSLSFSFKNDQIGRLWFSKQHSIKIYEKNMQILIFYHYGTKKKKHVHMESYTAIYSSGTLIYQSTNLTCRFHDCLQ